MADVKWIKIVTDIFDDEKILLIESLPDADTVIVIWFKLLCLAGKTNYGGVLLVNDRIHYTDEMLATIFRRPLNTVKLALSTFEQYGMIEIINDTITIPNWEKHQSVEKLELIKERARIRKRNQRERERLLSAPDDMSRDSHVTVTDDVTQCHATEEDKDKDRDRDKEIHFSSNPKYIDVINKDKGITISTVISLPLIDGTDYGVSQTQFDKWESLYPAVDVMQELRNMAGWLDGNPKNRKTRNGITRFITSWLCRKQDNARRDIPKRDTDVFAQLKEEYGQ